MIKNLGSKDLKVKDEPKLERLSGKNPSLRVKGGGED